MVSRSLRGNRPFIAFPILHAVCLGISAQIPHSRAEIPKHNV